MYLLVLEHQWNRAFLTLLSMVLDCVLKPLPYVLVTSLVFTLHSMAENDVETELLDYEDDEEPQTAPESAAPAGKKEVKGSYVSIHSSGFRDFLLKPELLRAIVDCGFEHPSEGKD